MTTLTIRGPLDVAKIIPTALGFRPDHSIVMLTFGLERPFHARIDIPDTDDRRAFTKLADTLIAPCHKHGVTRVVLAAYDGTLDYVTELAGAMTAAGIEVLLTCAIDTVDGLTRVTTMDGEDWDQPAHGITREEIRASITPTGTHTPMWTQDTGSRDEGLLALSVENARDTVTALRAELANSDPKDPSTGSVAALLAIAAWVSGDGALAWMAHDIGTALIKSPLLDAVSILLTNAVPPSEWDALRSTLMEA